MIRLSKSIVGREEVHGREKGHKIKMAVTDFETDAVDIPSDLIRVNLKMKNDTLYQKYKHEN